MKFIDKLEKKYSKYTIHNLMMYIVAANALVFVFDKLTRADMENKLALIPSYVFNGEIWRVFTFLMIPPNTSYIFIFFALYFYYMIGQTLEHEWGGFKFNVYYFAGWLIMVISSLLFGTVAQVSYLNITLFFAFATIYPNYEIRLYFILPVKVKYLAYLSAGIYVFSFLVGGFSTKISILAGLSNYILFFGKDLVTGRANRVKNVSRKNKYVKSTQSAKPYMHKCQTCGQTELDDSSLEFRYCSKCEGHYEYCSEHLVSHEHITTTNDS